MALGKYCQMCGAEKRPWEVIAEARGITVTSPCLMSKIFTEQSKGKDLRPELRFCRYCGAEQQPGPADHCSSCGKPLTVEAARADLEKIGTPAELIPRVIAFIIDLIVVAGIATAALLLWRVLAESTRLAIAIDYQSIIGAGVIVFVLYHTLFTRLLHRTPGKVALGLRVVMKDGSAHVSLRRSFIRSLLYLLVIYVLPIGFIPLVVVEPKTRWLSVLYHDTRFHDEMTDTEVIRIKTGA